MALKDLFKPKWKNSNSKVRLEGLDCNNIELEDVIDIAKNDDCIEVRIKAVSKIDDIPTLETLYNNARDVQFGECTNNRINSLLSDQIIETDKQEEIEELIVKINDELVIFKLILSIDDKEKQYLLTTHIGSKKLVAKLAREIDCKKIGTYIISKIDDEDTLKSLAYKAANSATKRHAKKKLKNFKKEKKHIDKEEPIEEVNKTTVIRNYTPEILKYENLCDKAENSLKYDDAFINDLSKEWEKLGEIPKYEYALLSNRFNEALKMLKVKESEILRELAIRENKIKNLEKIINELKEIILSDDLTKASKVADKLQRGWKKEREGVINIEELEEEFESLSFEIDNKLKVVEETERENKATELDELHLILKKLDTVVIEDNFIKNKDKVKHLSNLWDNTQTKLTSNDHSLKSKFKKLIDIFYKNLKDEYHNNDQEREINYKKKQTIVDEAYLLSKGDDYLKIAKELKHLKIRWKEIGPVPRELSDDIWNKFNEICNPMYEKIKICFDELDKNKLKNLSLKIALCKQVEKMANAEVNIEVANKCKEIQKAWKTVGPAPKEEEEDIYTRFRTACDNLFHKLDLSFADVKIEKAKLAEESEKIINMDFKSARKFAKEIKEKWDKLGRISYKDDKELGNKFFGNITKFYDKLNENPEDNLAKKKELFEQVDLIVNGIDEKTNYKEIGIKIKEIQAEWSTIGNVPEENKNIQKEFNNSANKFFDKQHEFYNKLDASRGTNLIKKEELIKKTKDILNSDEHWNDKTDKIKEIQSEWKTIGPVPKEQDKDIWDNFNNLCNDFFNDKKEFFGKRHDDQNENYKRKLELCIRLEQLANIEVSEDKNAKVTKSLEDELNMAFTANFAATATTNEYSSKIDEVIAIQRKWKTIGHVPKSKEKALYNRYKTLTDSFFSN